MINSISEAFHILDTNREGIPFEAIGHLYDLPVCDEVRDRIIYSLVHAYDGTFFDEAEQFYLPAPLWYAIVAEQHTIPELIDPVISLFTCTEDDWDFLNEQGMFLVCQLAEAYPDIVIPRIMDTIEDQIRRKSQTPFLFLFDAIYYTDVNRDKERLLAMLKGENFVWREAFASLISELQIKEAIPIIRDLKRQAGKDRSARNEYQFCLDQLNAGTTLHPSVSGPYASRRSNWKEHYQAMESQFHETEDGDDSDDENPYLPPDTKTTKVGRNDPCPCGSDLKYKKCCLAKDKSNTAKDDL